MIVKSLREGTSVPVDGGIKSSEVFLRPDGHLGGTGFDGDDGTGLLALLTARVSSDVDAARSYFRRLAADHVRRLVAVAEDGRMPESETLAICRPDALARFALLAALPPMTGGEYWTDGALCALYDRLEQAIGAVTEKVGGDFLAFVRSLRLLAGGGLDGVAASGADTDDATAVRATGELKDLLHDLLSPEAVSATALPNGLDAILRPYQRVGVDYLCRTTGAGLGACLADDMGLGKARLRPGWAERLRGMA